jgi:hypothetical protein
MPRTEDDTSDFATSVGATATMGTQMSQLSADELSK